MWLERRIRDLAARQHGLVSRSQIAALGASDDHISWRLASGRIVSLHPGVYYLDSVPLTWKTEVQAGVMAAGADALASHRTAAVLWELDGVYGRMIDVTVPCNEQPEPGGVVLHRTRRVNAAAIVDAIPVTSVEKTLLDLASMVPERVLLKAARSAVSKLKTTPGKMDLAVGTFGGRGVSGTRKTRRVIQLVADDSSASAAEIDLRQIVMDSPLPRPVQQLRIRLPGGENAYPDFAWPDRMRIVEVDGFEAHGTPDQLQHDLWRQNQLMELGWELRRFTATDVRDQAQRVKDEIVRFVNKPFREGLPGHSPA